jgi:hypothetical protein
MSQKDGKPSYKHKPGSRFNRMLPVSVEVCCASEQVGRIADAESQERQDLSAEQSRVRYSCDEGERASNESREINKTGRCLKNVKRVEKTEQTMH